MSSTTATPVARTPRPGLGPVLELQHVTRVHGDGARQIRALYDLSMVVMPGELVAVMGPSGSGKSTLLALAGALDVPTDGTVIIEGQVLDDLSQSQLAAIRRRHVGYVFQDFNLLPALTAAENVALPLELDGTRPGRARRIAVEALREVGLQAEADRFPEQLSGGQQQRVAIARALAMDPEILLLDEVTSALDPEVVDDVLNILRQVAETTDVTMLIVTHEMGFARDVSHKVMMFDGGHIVEEGHPEKMFTDPDEERTKKFLSAVLGK